MQATTLLQRNTTKTATSFDSTTHRTLLSAYKRFGRTTYTQCEADQITQYFEFLMQFPQGKEQIVDLFGEVPEVSVMHV